MNKRMVIFSSVLIGILIVFKFCANKPDQVNEEEQKPAPLSISQNSSPFNESFSKLLQSYYSLKDAFAKADITNANSAATTLSQNADNLNLAEIKGDSSIQETAKYFSSTISNTARQITTEVEPAAKLSEFNMITDALWSLTRTVKYDQQKIYYMTCPKALDNNGGFWMSEKIETTNPYGLKENCSDVTDSLDYSKK